MYLFDGLECIESHLAQLQVDLERKGVELKELKDWKVTQLKISSYVASEKNDNKRISLSSCAFPVFSC